LDSNFFWITASGLDKGRVEPGDFVKISIETGLMIHAQKPGQKPSAESSIHRIIYKNRREAGAVLHVHNPESLSLQPGLSRENPTALWNVPPTELVKAMGFWEENPKLRLPIIYNYAKVEEISKKLDEFFRMSVSDNLVPSILVEHHGPSVWGKDLEEAHRHLEAMEYIFRVSRYYVTSYV
jgi:methylthioribulose-1-phosphate dehydratase